MGTIIGRFHKNPLKTAKGVAETRLNFEIVKGHNSGKNQSSITSIKYDHLHANNNWKVSSKSLENCRRSCGDKIVSTDGRTDGRMEGRTDGWTSPLL